MSLLGPLLISLFAILAIETSESYRHYKVLVVDPGVLSNGKFTNSHWCSYDYRKSDITDQEFKDSEYDILLYINEKFATNNAIDVYHKERPNAFVRAELLRQLEYRLEQLKLRINNVDEKTYARIKQRVSMVDHMIDGSELSYQRNAGNVGYIFGFMIFLFIFTFGIQVLRGVIEEKTNRVVEIVISSVSAVQLMIGKIVGIGLVALSQFVVWTFLTSVIMLSVKDEIVESPYEQAQQIVQNGSNENIANQANGIEINEVATLIYEAVNYPNMLAYFLFFLVFGYLFYAGIFASIGAAVDNDTDSQQFLLPVVLPLLFSFVIGWLAIIEPGNNLVSWFSHIPFTSPIVMMIRLPLLEPHQYWEVFLSMGILLASVGFMFYMSARIYRIGILRYGKKARFSDLWRWALKG